MQTPPQLLHVSFNANSRHIVAAGVEVLSLPFHRHQTTRGDIALPTAGSDKPSRLHTTNALCSLLLSNTFSSSQGLDLFLALEMILRPGVLLAGAGVSAFFALVAFPAPALFDTNSQINYSLPMNKGVMSPASGSLSNVATGTYSSPRALFWRSNTTYGSQGPAFITEPLMGKNPTELAYSRR